MELQFCFASSSTAATEQFLIANLGISFKKLWPPIMGVPFAFHDYKDIISASPGLDYAEKRNVSHSANGIIKPSLFYIDAYCSFAKSSWYTG